MSELYNTPDDGQPPVDGLRCRVGAGHGWTILVLEGELDFSQSHAARGALLSLQLLRHGRLAIDLRGLTFMDTSGIRLILEAMQRAEARGAEFALVRGPQPVHDVLELVGLAEQLRIVPDPAALAGETSPPGPARVAAHHDLLQAIGHTPLVRLQRLSPNPQVRIWAKLESQNPTGSIKDRVARGLIEAAEARQAIGPGQTILAPATANSGISLAMVCACKGYRLKAVVPRDVTPEYTQLLRIYGAEIVSSPAAEQDAHLPDYHGDQAHYDGTAPEILQELGELDAFVSATGTGATLMGTGRRLREELGEKVRIVAVEPRAQSLDGRVDPSLLDRRTVVSNRDAITWTRRLLEQEGIFAGVSAGASASIAVRLAQELDQGDVVFVVGDGGWKYLSSGLYTRPVQEIEDTIGWW